METLREVTEDAEAAPTQIMSTDNQSRSLTLPEVADSLSQSIDEFKIKTLNDLQANVVDAKIDLNQSEARMNAARESINYELSNNEELRTRWRDAVAMKLREQTGATVEQATTNAEEILDLLFGKYDG